jgi:hypothetical protein
MKRVSRNCSKLSESLNRQLNAYALAAGAAGVGLLALTQPAEAKIVYTPAHRKITQFPKVVLDLNHDGNVDFVLLFGGDASSCFATTYLLAYGYRSGNGVIPSGVEKSFNQALALRPGARIGSDRSFDDNGLLARLFSPIGRRCGSTAWVGQWADGGKGLKNRYLGLKFSANGKGHFGWARVTVTTSGSKFTATLTGYAYETIPNKSILAGQTKGKDEGQGASLGALAAGAVALHTSK